MPSFLLSAAVCILIAILITTFLKPKKTHKLPPGPPGLPIIGNLPEIPTKHSWLKFKEWSDQYGPLMRLSIAGKDHYVASSEKVANELMRERGNIYSGREQLPAAAVLLSDNLRPLFLPYDNVWRNGRKFTHAVTNTTIVPTYEPTQNLESARTLLSLIREPAKYEHWFERYASGIISRLAFGKPVKTGHEPEIRQIFEVVHTVEDVASPGAYLVDVLPWLMWVPRVLAPWKRELERLHAKELRLFRKLMGDVKEKMAKGAAPKCWEREMIERREEFRLTEDQGAYVVGTLFEAGAGTTAAALMSFLLAIVQHTHWLTTLQQEIDSVCPPSRLPTLSDMPDLPTVRAVVKETLRWRPVTAGGVPHLCTKNDTYNGFFIPAGTNVHANQWAIHREEALYPDPESFKPERWLEASYPTFREPLGTYPNLHNFSAFGFGRRICPGQNIAERSIYLMVARIAWGCDIRRKRDESGKEIVPPEYDFCSGFNVQPNWFPFELSVRSGGRLKVLEREVEENARLDPLRGTK